MIFNNDNIGVTVSLNLGNLTDNKAKLPETRNETIKIIISIITVLKMLMYVLAFFSKSIVLVKVLSSEGIIKLSLTIMLETSQKMNIKIIPIVV